MLPLPSPLPQLVVIGGNTSSAIYRPSFAEGEQLLERLLLEEQSPSLKPVSEATERSPAEKGTSLAPSGQH